MLKYIIKVTNICLRALLLRLRSVDGRPRQPPGGRGAALHQAHPGVVVRGPEDAAVQRPAPARLGGQRRQLRGAGREEVRPREGGGELCHGHHRNRWEALDLVISVDSSR